MNKKNFNILIVGVGGQGNILSGKIISQAFVSEGYDVKQSEVHGMAQRGGAVSAHVRAGEKIYSPLIPEEEADFILAFEKLEILRYLNYASGRTHALVNDMRLDPPSVAAGKQEYPSDILQRIGKKTKNILVVDATGTARTLGNERVVNSVLVGVLAAYLPLKDSTWKKMYKMYVAEKLLDINLRAFDAGRRLCTEQTCFV